MPLLPMTVSADDVREAANIIKQQRTARRF